jgi:hypothetical protein
VTSHAGLELLGEEYHARILTDLGEEAYSKVFDAGDELDGLSCVLLLRPICS